VLPPDFIGAPLDYAFDFARMEREMRACEDHFVYTPAYQGQVDGGLSGAIPFMSESAENYRQVETYAGGIRKNALKGVRTIYLRNSEAGDVVRDPRYAVTKALKHRTWFWRPELVARIPYTIECIESLPYNRIGLIRAFISEDTFMPTHRDMAPGPGHRRPYSKRHAIGISLIPATGGVGMLIWNERERRAVELRGHCLVFDDSRWHGVPMTTGMRITLRIFGDIDFERLGPHVKESCHA
jgi:hypothetical protein